MDHQFSIVLNGISYQTQLARKHLNKLSSMPLASLEKQLLLEDVFEDIADILNMFEATSKDLRKRQARIDSIQKRIEIEGNGFSQLFESTSNGYLVTTVDGIIQKANAAAAQLIHAPYQEALAKIPLIAFVRQSKRSEFCNQLSKIRWQKQIEGLGLELRRWDKSIFSAQASVFAIENDLAERVGLLWLIQAVEAPDSAKSKDQPEVLKSCYTKSSVD